MRSASTAAPITSVVSTARAYCRAPDAMPTAIAKKMNPMSRVSGTERRKRMIEKAAKTAKARSRLCPTTMITAVTTMPRMIRVCT